MVGPPGSGKSMLAARLPSILPPLETSEMLEDYFRTTRRARHVFERLFYGLDDAAAPN